MKKGWLRVTGFGTGINGSKGKCELYFPVDPGYKDTARMLVEMGLCTIFEEATMARKGGFHTPASAGGNDLLKRLCATGCQFRECHEIRKKS